MEELSRRAVGPTVRAYLRDLLRDARGNIAEAARRAGAERTWLSRLAARHGVDPEEFKPK